MNDRELEARMRDAFDAVDLPDAVRQRTLETLDDLAAGQSAGKPEPSVVTSNHGSGRAARKARRGRLITALAACLVVGVAVFGIFRVGGATNAPVETAPGEQGIVAPMDMVATAFVDIDINPSIELQLNASDQVVAVDAMNDDGRSVIASLELEGLSYDEALAKLTQSEALAPYLDRDAYVQVSVASDSQQQEQELMSMSARQLAPLPCRGSCDAVSLELHEEAHAHGMGCGRYIAAVELSTLDPDITVEDCHDMSMREIRDRIDACHGGASSGAHGSGAMQGGGYGGHHGESRGRHHA